MQKDCVTTPVPYGGFVLFNNARPHRRYYCSGGGGATRPDAQSSVVVSCGGTSGLAYLPCTHPQKNLPKSDNFTTSNGYLLIFT